jgi:phage baseplate assembly protein gpV
MKALFAYLALTVAPEKAVWVDPATQLMWTAADNHSGLSWRQAERYCRDLKTGAHSDWRLPTIDELQVIYQPHDDSNSAFHLRGPLQLSGWEWSATPGKQPGENWSFDFGDGGRASVAGGDSGLNRALCVRQTYDGKRPENPTH